jgi:hypothetical protein
MQCVHIYWPVILTSYMHITTGATDTRTTRATSGRDAAADTAASFAHGRPASDGDTYVRYVGADAGSGSTCVTVRSQPGRRVTRRPRTGWNPCSWVKTLISAGRLSAPSLRLRQKNKPERQGAGHAETAPAGPTRPAAGEGASLNAYTRTGRYFVGRLRHALGDNCRQRKQRRDYADRHATTSGGHRRTRMASCGGQIHRRAVGCSGCSG